MAEHPKNQSEPSKTHDLVKPGSTIDPKGQAAPPPAQGKPGDQKQGEISTYGQNMPGETDAERMRREDPLFIEKTRPEDPSGRAGQLTRDNVNPHIPSVTREQLGPAIARIQNPGGIVDPTSLGMEQGGVAATYPDTSDSINEPDTKPGTDYRGELRADTRTEPPPDLPPGHGNFSINEPPGSSVGGEGEGAGGEESEAPDLESLDPDEADAGDAEDIVMHVHGTGFTEQSVIYFNGLQEPTTFVSATEVTTGVKPSLFVVPAVCPVTVRNGEHESDALEFEFLDPEEPVAARETKRTTRTTKAKTKPKKSAKKGKR